MNTNKNTKTLGALATPLAPQKTRIFSISATERGVRIRMINNAPQVVQEQRIRAD